MPVPVMNPSKMMVVALPSTLGPVTESATEAVPSAMTA